MPKLHRFHTDSASVACVKANSKTEVSVATIGGIACNDMTLNFGAPPTSPFEAKGKKVKGTRVAMQVAKASKQQHNTGKQEKARKNLEEERGAHTPLNPALVLHSRLFPQAHLGAVCASMDAHCITV